MKKKQQPNWKRIDKKVKWATTDSDGQSHGYSIKPTLFIAGGEWLDDGGFNIEIHKDLMPPFNPKTWDKIIYERP